MAANPFSSDWLGGGRDERLRPQGTLSYVAGRDRRAAASS